MKPIGIIINDIHLNKDNSELVKDIFFQLISICDKYKVNKIFCGGDVFTNRSGQPLSCLTTWRTILQVLSDYDIEFHVIPGNHDKTDSDSELSYLDVFNENCFYLHSKEDIVKIGSCVIGFMPFFTEDEWIKRFDLLNKKINKYEDKNKILITHIAVDGVKNNDGSSVNSSITPSLFKNWDKVFVGHYHNASKLSKKIIYTGSAYQNNFGETIDDKGFTVLYDDGSTEFEPSKFPKFIKEVVDATDKEEIRKLLESYENDSVNHIRFIIRGKRMDCEKINVEEIKKRGVDCKFETIETNEAIDASESDAVLSYNKSSIKKDFMRFCSENKINGEKLKYGLKLINEIRYVES